MILLNFCFVIWIGRYLSLNTLYATFFLLLSPLNIFMYIVFTLDNRVLDNTVWVRFVSIKTKCIFLLVLVFSLCIFHLFKRVFVMMMMMLLLLFFLLLVWIIVFFFVSFSFNHLWLLHKNFAPIHLYFSILCQYTLYCISKTKLTSVHITRMMYAWVY